MGLFHVHAAVRQVAGQPELLPAEVRRLLHVRHGQEQGKKGKKKVQGCAKIWNFNLKLHAYDNIEKLVQHFQHESRECFCWLVEACYYSSPLSW